MVAAFEIIAMAQRPPFCPPLCVLLAYTQSPQHPDFMVKACIAPGIRAVPGFFTWPLVITYAKGWGKHVGRAAVLCDPNPKQLYEILEQGKDYRIPEATLNWGQSTKHKMSYTTLTPEAHHLCC